MSEAATRERPILSLASIFAVATAISAVSLLVGSGPSIARLSFSVLHVGTLIVSAGFLFGWIMVDARKGLWSPSAAYLAVFWVFHFGVVALSALSILPSNPLTAYASAWLYTESGHAAVYLSLVAFVSVIAGAGIGRFLILNRRRSHSGSADRRLGRVVGVTGTGLLLVCSAVWAGLLFSRGGFRIFAVSYADYLEAIEGLGWVLGMLWLVCGWGLILASSAPKGRVRALGLTVFFILGTTAFLLGTRGQILFPLVAAGIARAKGEKFLTLRQTLLAAFLLLLAVSAVRTLRVSGVGRVSNAEISFSAVEGLQELGMSLKPVERAVSWRQTGDPLRFGETYWAPIDRALVHVLPDWKRPPAATDDRLLNVLTLYRAGPIGFSPVAEAYLNFGLPGVVVAMGLLGVLLGRFDSLPPTLASRLVIGIMMIPLLVNVRNSFAEIPARLVLSALFLIVLLTASRVIHIGGRKHTGLYGAGQTA